MLAKINRVLKEKDFEYIFKNSRSSYGKILGVKAAHNQIGINRFGVVISRKVSKKSVIRNKIKRRIRSLARQANVFMKPGYDILLIVLPAAAISGYKDLEQEIRNNFNILKLFK